MRQGVTFHNGKTVTADDAWKSIQRVANPKTPLSAGGQLSTIIDFDATKVVDDTTLQLVLKNPYNTVRVPWLRALLPDAVIAGVVRRPLPNVFSLFKKHVENPHVHRGPEEGWWGVKPAGWRGLAGLVTI